MSGDSSLSSTLTVPTLICPRVTKRRTAVINLNIVSQPYRCRIKELLWFQEMKQAIDSITQDGRTIIEIKELSKKENIFNAASKSRANEIGCALANRLAVLDDAYLQLFINQNVEMQKLLCVISVMLQDHTLFEFMDNVYKEKLIANDFTIKNAEFIGFIHELQSRDENASAWTDAAVKKLRDYLKAILRDGGLLSKEGEPRTIIKPIITKEVADYLEENGLIRIRKILTGER